MYRCKKCGSFELAYIRQTASNGMLQLKLFCTKCGSYIKFLPHDEKHKYADVTPDEEKSNHVCIHCEYFIDKLKCGFTGEDIKAQKEQCLFFVKKG